MARLVVKVKYLKPTKKRTPGRYARYIGTRDGVDKIDDSVKYRETTYADYIATRPRSEKIGTHGLFTDAGVEVDLNKVSDELNNYKGTIWTVIVSIRREDAEMLGFDTGERWRNMVRANRDELAKNFKIHPSSLQWYGAFHNESYHPHIHLIVYDKENRGYLDKDGIENIKSTFAHVIFRDEMLNLQNEKTDSRDKLRLHGKDEIETIINQIHDGQDDNLMLQALLVDLQNRLKNHNGKKVYGYLSKDDKYLVDKIVDEIEKIPAVKELYELWYEKQEDLYRIYSESKPIRIPLSANPEFKSIRNAVINAVSDLGNSQDSSKLILFPKEDEDIVGIDMSLEESHNMQYVASYIPKTANNTQDIACYHQSDNQYMAGNVIRLLNQVGRIFRNKFQDNPNHAPKVDIKLRQKILEKDQAHGVKHEIT